jgi:hypothetical protein
VNHVIEKNMQTSKEKKQERKGHATNMGLPKLGHKC